MQQKIVMCKPSKLGSWANPATQRADLVITLQRRAFKSGNLLYKSILISAASHREEIAWCLLAGS